MTDVCRSHPQTAATATCVQCRQPICDLCRETISGKTLCHSCVQEIRTRLEREIPPAAIGHANRANVPKVTHLLTGTCLGIVVGVVGAVLLDKFTFYTHFQLGYINALVGFAIGYAVLYGAKAGGLVTAVIAAVIALASAMLGFGLLMSDEIARGGSHLPPAELLQLFPSYLRTLNILDWLIVAIGVYGGFKTPYQARLR